MILNPFNEQSNKQAIRTFFDSFTNFLNKSPLIFSKIEKLDSTYYLYFLGDDHPIVFPVYLNKEKHHQIKNLKNLLLPSYPVISTPLVCELSTAERTELVDSGSMTLEEALQATRTTYKERYRIIRIHNKYNELDIEDLENNNRVLKCKLNIPVISFLMHLKETGEDNEKIFNLFSKHVRIICELIPEHNWRKD
jgi:hypothetical protein